MRATRQSRAPIGLAAVSSFTIDSTAASTSAAVGLGDETLSGLRSGGFRRGRVGRPVVESGLVTSSSRLANGRGALRGVSKRNDALLAPQPGGRESAAAPAPTSGGSSG